MAFNSTCTSASDDVFGPAVHGCRDNFDFTLLFEQTILSIAPSALLLLCTPVRLVQLGKSSVKTLYTPILATKAAASLALLGIQIALVALWTTHAATRASVPAAALSFLDAIAIISLSAAEHVRSVRPSSLLNLYLVISIPLDICQLRTLYLRHENRGILALSTASIAVKFVIFLLENRNKESVLRLPYKRWTPWATSGMVNRTFFWWLNPLFWKGFRHLLALDDLYTPDQELLSESLQQRMEKPWAEYASSGRYALLRASVSCLRRPLLMTIVPRLCLIGFNYSQPFLISTAVTYVGEPNASQNDGYGLIGATSLIYLGMAISTAHYQHRIDRAVTMFRGTVVSFIYAKTLRLQSGVYDESKAVTLMSTDVDKIATNIENVLEIWARVAEIGIGIWLLERQLGWVCVAPVIVTLACTYGALRIANLIGPAMMAWMGAIQKRVGITSSMLASMKSIKMLGLSNTLAVSIQSQRVRELDLSAKFRWLGIYRNVLSATPALVGPLLTFAIFAIEAAARGTSNLSTVQAFTSLSIISLLTTPAQALITSLPAFSTALACFERIQTYLLAQPWDDERVEDKFSFSGSEDDRKSVGLVNITPIQQNRETVRVHEACIRPSKEASFSLQSISFKASSGTLNVVIGPVGSGKSTLLKAILGELKCDSGTIQVVSKRMAYCSQTPWLQNATVRQIVCGDPELEIDQDWYHTVIYACALDEEVQHLPNGHDSLIGSRGVTLSGGQKQRLALARAAYARRDIILLDDVLSALDTETEALILQRLLGKNGLFQKLGYTVILATHAVWNLSQADNIIVLDGTGHLIEQGTFEDLKAQNGFVSGILQAQTPARKEQEPKAPAAKKKPLPKGLSGPSASDIEDLTRRTGDISVYKYYFASIGWKLSVGLLLTVALNTLSASFPQVWLKWYTDGTVKGVGLFASIYAVFIITALVMTTASMVIMFLKAIPKSGAGIHQILLDSVMRAPQSFFDKTDSGITLNRFSQDMSLVDGTLPVSVIIALQALFNCIAAAALVSLGSSYMALTIPGLLCLLYLLQKVYLRTSRQMRYLDLEAKSPLYTNFVETLEGLATIRALGWEPRFTTLSNQRLNTSQRPYYLMFCIQRWLTVVLQLLIGGMAVIVVGLAVSLRNTTSGGNLGIALTSILTFNTNVQFLMTWWTALETSLGAIARTKNFAEQTPREDQPGEDFVPSEDWPLKGGIEFRDLSASYGKHATALQSISMNIAPGEKIGICGRTGSGKSSLLSALLRILDLDSGSIWIDGIDLSQVPRDLIRSRVVVIPQDPFTLSGSVRLNADPTESISDDRIISAMKKVQLWDTLQERGGLDVDMTKQPLSQGQQQLFCLGRALLRTESKILVLDEATSSTNVETDQLMRNLIRTEFSNHTIITVAHRLDTIIESDKVAVLEKGVVVEFGDPKTLLETGSAFKQLYQQGE